MIKKIYNKLTYQGSNPLDTQIFQRLTRLYVIALLAVALLSLIGQILIQVFLNSLLDDSHVVNIAGRQRMLSQRLSKTAILLCRPQVFQADAEYYSNDIKDIISLWEESHEGLKNKNLKTDGKSYTVRNSEKTDSMFREIDPIFRVILVNAKNINKAIQKPVNNQQEVLQHSLNQILVNERAFLQIMNKIVFQYDLESRNRVDTTKKVELFLFILLFSILVLEGAFIFRPMANNIRLVIKKLTDSESNLRQTNETLIKTREALVQATEEKYKLQLAEEKVRAASLIEGQESERRRLAADLHDGIGQMLTGLRLHSEKVKSFNFANVKQAKSFEELQKLIQETIETTRTVSFNLAPSVLSDFGVVPAIRILSEQVSKMSEIKIDFQSIKLPRLSEGVETCLYRITQEAIHNAVKYSKATLINVQITNNENFVKLAIIDNGEGFELPKKRKTVGGSGLKNMQARAELLHGSFKIQSKIGKGTTINVSIPLDGQNTKS
ncbi:ATP-binding protein [Arcicella sp. LKC2W]|uniref:ATP-binding protein n=1 Tax=Arcicella sp. LKC2W TaxID=2984198 RepID=UPI002B1FED09|nr:ATP-binding protein [Arcicella sp. LKC2W]MEA5459618.1 ATP-binding protein [Arcicella sp. LKC2W]